jgi:glycosyltransferase involved in cell wall biosynthesis
MPQLSIVIPTYNRAETLCACLEALCRQTQSAEDFEVIVVVDGSTDATSDKLANLSTPYRLQVICQRNSGQGVARNRGVEVASGRYCLFLDDDIIADPRLVTEHLKAQKAQEGIVGLGQLTIRLPDRADGFACYIAEWWKDHYIRLNRDMRPPSFLDCYSGNMSVPRAALLEAGGFAVDLSRSEDIELGYRFELQGLSFVYIPEAIGHQVYHKGFREIAADAEKAGVAGVELYRRHPSILPSLRLGRFGRASLREILLRRLLLFIGFPSRSLAIFGRLLGRSSWARAWYHFLDRYCYWCGVRRAAPDRETWHRLTQGPIFVMYHSFGGQGEPPSRYIIPAGRFVRQMAWLKWRRYHVLSLEEFLRYHREYRLPPARSVVITFDDGYADNRTIAFPILRKYGFPATIFLVSGAVGASNQWDCDGELAGRCLLSWSDIQEMRDGGIHFGSHTRTHVLLTAVPLSQMEDEVAGSRLDLEQKIGCPILAFAYPYGKYDVSSQETAERAGFLGACSCHSGVNDPATPLYILRRTEIHGNNSLIRFVLTLWIGTSHVQLFLRS